MLGDSLAGAASLLGETMTLQVVDSESYSTATRAVTKTTSSYTVTRVTIRGITTSDKRRLGTQLVKESTEMASILASALPTGVAPSVSSRLVDAAGRTWEILSVRTTKAGGVVTGYSCQVTGR